ncbi:MAG: glucose-methanol-choline oxidoreductase [Rhodobacterales bacterium]|nr:MAG: glucose-methanol-choline oxidoreductase [Rhodobacterales bacterium]
MRSALTETRWDVIVIGTGIGGGTVARALAEAGRRVLMLEKGAAGHRAEQTPLSHDIFVPEARALRGFWPGQMRADVDGQVSRFFGPLGAGVGGSSLFYAATLERPEPHDLDHSDAHPHPTGGWPVAFAEFAPWLDRAGALYKVNGTQDPLSAHPAGTLAAPPPPAPGDAALIALFERAGLHPYQLHTALAHLEGCKSCLGFKCPRACKMDGRSAGVEPALATGNAAVMDRSEVTRLIGDGQRITGVEVRREGETLILTGDHYILAGGAFGSPRLALASACEAFPNGVANSSGLVGRGLMFHLNEMFAIWPGGGFDGPSKSVGFRDHYHVDGQRLGMVQALGVDASYGEIAWYLRNLVEASRWGRLPGLAGATRIPAALAARLLGNARIFVGLMEDLPYDHNRVLPPDHGDEIGFEYRISDELKARRKLFRRRISRGLKGHRRMFLAQRPELNFGHPSGTMRFGNDPARAVLRSDGRTHDVVNLWGADAGFMPTSMGVNPSLSIAAQALRVADAIVKGGRDGTQ